MPDSSAPEDSRRAPDGVTLLLGGARSGKSTLAVDIGRRFIAEDSSRAVTFVATAPALDDDMRARIDHHRATRPTWPTHEAPLDLTGALTTIGTQDLVIIDCLTLWVSNAMFADWTDDQIVAAADDCAGRAAARPAPTVVVSNEVGMGVHPETELGRRYRDVLGRVNARWAAHAQRSLLLVAGRAMVLDDPWRQW